MERIKEIVDHTPLISDLQRKFYMTMLTDRKERILDFSVATLKKKENRKQI